jgi:hypothetical protein
MVFAETEDHKETDTCCHAHTGLSAGGRGVAFGVPAPAPVDAENISTGTTLG